MPKALFAIWWDDKLGPFVGRYYPEDQPISGEEALAVFMGHGVNHEAKFGYTKISQGLVVSYMEAPNCIGVLLNDDDDPAVVERNLLRLIKYIDLTSSDWDKEVKAAFETLLELIDETSGAELLTRPAVQKMIDDMYGGRLPAIKPRHIFRSVAQYPEAGTYLGQDDEEVERTLRDLENERVLVAKTFGRTIKCRQCGGRDVEVTLLCPVCDSPNLHNVYQVFCPKCSEMFQTVIVDELSEVRCQRCLEAVEVHELEAIDVDPLCNDCGRASDEPKIVLTCSDCGKHLKGVDLLGGTGLAYSPDLKEE
ncbi:MAG: hypothetical protein JSW61_07760 [Candidatus Thorarchaeota archaeon]|nr:MAG: hypothetical protein JSW61_07760 [Candidatus Thorarchaeota archaeon]